jgi:hypothetical protein
VELDVVAPIFKAFDSLCRWCKRFDKIAIGFRALHSISTRSGSGWLISAFIGDLSLVSKTVGFKFSLVYYYYFLFLRDSSQPVNTEDCSLNNVASHFFFFFVLLDRIFWLSI